MESEIEQNSHLLPRIQEVFRKKYWYSVAPDGGFDWKQSVQYVALQLQEEIGWGDPSLVQKAIEDAFTPDSLTRVEGKNSGPLIAKAYDLVKQHKGELYVWTVGDPDWQPTKFQRCGLDQYVDDDHYLRSSTAKEDLLHNLLSKLSQQRENNQTIHVYAIDDKPTNLAAVMQMAEEFAGSGVHLDNYHMKLDDPLADATACYRYLEERTKAHSELGDKPVLVFDQDGVLTDTDGTILEVACRNILRFATTK